MKHWLLKTEPESYSIDQLKRDKRTCWDGVRNYQARNFIRDDMKLGDLVLLYHSNADPAGVVGIASVCREAYADHTAQDPKDHHYDPKASAANPIWMMVDIKFVKKFKSTVTLEAIKNAKDLEGILVAKRGQRLSVQPVEKAHFEVIRRMGA
ncbi:MAG: EVE domain-containing protein [Phycisphaeraceae bacterium]